MVDLSFAATRNRRGPAGAMQAIDAAAYCRAVRRRRSKHRLAIAMRRAGGPAAMTVAALLGVAACLSALRTASQTDMSPWVPAGRSVPASVTTGGVAISGTQRGERRIVYLHADEDIAAGLIRGGVESPDAARAAQLIGAAVFPDTIPAGSSLAIDLGPPAGSRRPLERIVLRPRADLLVTILRKAGTHAADRLVSVVRQIAVDATPMERSGLVGTDLAGSLQRARIPADVAASLRSALQERRDRAAGLLPTDRFTLIFEQNRAADGRTETGDLLYAAFRRGGRPLLELARSQRTMALDDVAADGHVRADALPAVLPVSGRLTSRYGMRFHPLLGFTRLHAGVDVGARWGAPVVAPRAGSVVFAGWHGGHGNYIRLDHGGGLATGYAHLSRLAVATGQRAAAGQVIGYVGSTGLSTGPHLHYEVLRDGRPVDPLRSGPFAASIDRGFVAAVASLRALVREP